jgi:FkbM family methyltransferase
MQTRTKIYLARCLAGFLVFLRKLVGQTGTVVIKRRGAKWELDLTEGIDFSIYLFGGFELRTISCYRKFVRPGDVVIDVGANIGSHTLVFAELVGPTGQVHAFEPTVYALDKLKVNAKLNPTLEKRIIANQMMVLAELTSDLPNALYSSWQLFNSLDTHHGHFGSMMTTKGAEPTTIDSYVRMKKLMAVNVIKIDVDGYEIDVLKGAQDVIDRDQPLVVFEFAPYILKEHSGDPEMLLDYFYNRGYTLYYANTLKQLPRRIGKSTNLMKFRGSINVIASIKVL